MCNTNQCNLSKLVLLDYIEHNIKDANTDLQDKDSLELIQIACKPVFGNLSLNTIKLIAFIVLAAYNLAKANELIPIKTN